jgi:hypothetical protein
VNEMAQWFGSLANPSDRTYFTVQADSDTGLYGDWQAEEHFTSHHITGSNSNDNFFSGYGSEVLTLRLEFESREDYMAFRARRNTSGTLQLLAMFTSLDGTVLYEGGQQVERFANVYLRTPTNVQHSIGDGPSECTATFLWQEAS